MINPFKKIKKDKKKIESVEIVSYFSGVAKAKGLTEVFLNEVLIDKDQKPRALVIGFDDYFIDLIFLEKDVDLNQKLFRSYKTFTIKVSEDLIGRVVNGLGEPKDGLNYILGDFIDVFQKAPQIIDRQPITRSLITGIKVIDTSLPLGKGQRELIIGDRKLGKTTIAQDIVLNQKYNRDEVICIYVAIGQEKQKIQELLSLLDKHNSFLYTIVVASTADSALAEQFLSPFVGCSIGEHFRSLGKDVLIVYDDLTKHGKVYRDISLLLERSPGREAYPGDIFSLHANLLERAGQLSKKNGGGSLSALPIVETQEGDLTTFIPTNLISITDGQIYLERDLFQKGFLPAINIGLSVSRIGSQAQPNNLTEVVGSIRLTWAQYKELAKLIRLQTNLTDVVQNKVLRGELILELLKQNKHTYFSWMEQMVLFYAINEGFFDHLEKEKLLEVENLLLKFLNLKYKKLITDIRMVNFSSKLKLKIDKFLSDFQKEFL